MTTNVHTVFLDFLEFSISTYIYFSSINMNFANLTTIIYNEDTGIQFLQNKNIIKTNEICENNHEMIIKRSRWQCHK